MKTEPGVIIISEDKKPKTPIEHLFYDYTLPYSFPFNYALFNYLKENGYSHKDSLEATILFGYLVSWQSFYTRKRKLEKGGYFYRSREAIRNDTGMIRDAQKRARDILEGEGLLKIKPMPGQSNRLKIKEKQASKYINRAVINYDTRHKKDIQPERNKDTNKDLELNDLKLSEGKGIASKMQPISFYEYQKRYKIDPNVHKEVNIIEYFLEKHAQVIGPGKHKDLKPVTWSEQLDTISSVELDNGKFDDALESDNLKDMINHYFSKANDGKYQSNCDFSIVHFNNPGIKKVNFYESALIASCYDDSEE